MVQIPPKKVPNHSPDHLLFRWISQWTRMGILAWLILGWNTTHTHTHWTIFPYLWVVFHPTINQTKNSILVHYDESRKIMISDTSCRNFLWQRNLPINFGLEKCILLLQGTLTTNAIVANRETRNNYLWLHGIEL